MKKDKHMLVVPDDFSDVDEIGYDKYSAGLVEMIRSVDAKGSFTIGIFGQWGQGKTSMLQQIKKRLDEIKAENEKEILTVWFNPWQFTGEEHIIIPFFHTLVSYLEEFKKKKKKVGEVIADFLKELAYVPVALSYGMEANIKIPLILETKFKFKDIIDESRKRKKKINSKADQEMKELVNKYESMYYRLISRLQETSKDLKLKIVVFIDDLDRCLPEKGVELLEGLKVLLDLSGFIFVIGVARDVVEQGIKVRYRELYSEEDRGFTFKEQDYLDKIIQFPLTLPPADVDRLKSMVANYLKDLEEVKPYLGTIQKSLGIIPRCLKRFINNLSYTFWVSGQEEDKKMFRVELLVKMTLIVFKFPAFYWVIGKTPAHLLLVQEILEKKKQDEKESEEEEPGEKDILKIAPKEKSTTVTGFPEIDELNLFDYPNLESITEILAKQKREGAVKDEGFENEKEVLRYVSLLSITSTSKDTRKAGTGDLRQTMESRMILIPAGTVLMKDEKSGNEFTAKISAFSMDKFPVTQGLYEMVMGEAKNRSKFRGGDRPVENVSWFEAVEFCSLLSDKVGLKRVYTIEGENVTPDWKADGFRLPTEAEWEYACRAGTIDGRYGGIKKIAWYKDNSNGSTQGVGNKEPNSFGLYDMLGNVWDWCWDWKGDYPKEVTIEWRGPDNGRHRVCRGGGWDSTIRQCTSAERGFNYPTRLLAHLGFRLARSLKNIVEGTVS